MATSPDFYFGSQNSGLAPCWVLSIFASVLWNQGIGHQLLRQGMADMRDEGYSGSIAWVLANNRRAEHFYLREGCYDGRSQLQAVKAGEYQQHICFRLLAGPLIQPHASYAAPLSSQPL